MIERPTLPTSLSLRVRLAAAGIVVLGLLLSGFYGLRRFVGTPPVAVEVVGRAPFVREVSATGTLKAVKATPIVVPVDSEGPQKVGWMAPDGARVKAGDPIVVFDPTEMEKSLQDGRADRATAQNKIRKTTAENRRTSLGLGLDLDVARSELLESETNASKDHDIFSRNEIIESQIDRDILKRRFDATDFRRSASARLGDADVALGEIERDKADIRIRQAEKALGALRVLAPHDGLLVLERNWRGETLTVGETLFPGQKIAEIPDLSNLEAKVYVLESDAGGLRPGLPARVRLEGRAGAETAAKVSRVDAMAKTRNWRVPTRFFETILALARTDTTAMKPGQAVRATVRLEDMASAISVPLGSVFEKDGKRIVYREENGRFAPVEVTVGRHSLSRVVIEKGLEPGDRVALRDPSREAAEIFESAGRPASSPDEG